MTLKSWMVRPLVLIAVAAMILVFMPVERVFAGESAPETKSETLAEVPVESSEVVDAPEGDGGDDADDAPDAVEDPTGDEPAGEDGDEAESSDDQTPQTSDEGETEEDPADAEGDADDADPESDDDEVLRERSEPMETPMPFTGLGFTGVGADAPEVHWRALLEDGTWTDWSVVVALDEFDGPDPDSDEDLEALDRAARWTSDAIWVGAATHLQLQVEGAALEDVEVTVIDSAGLTETLVAKVKRTLGSLGTAAPAEAAPGQPNIKSRADWGANENCTSGSVRYATPKASVVHHTATKSNYSRAEVPQQIRNMYHWHTACHGSGNGWNDIGYNFLVDRFGQVWEGRRGGIANGVIGAHAGGWNTGTFGVSVIGNFNQVSLSTASLHSLQELIAWKYHIHGIDSSPTATTWLNGQKIPRMVGHRNVRGSYSRNPSTTTDCPGQRIYTRMDEIRVGVDAAAEPWTPVVGDWNGNGTTTVGWYRDGDWRLRNSNSAGSPSLTIDYGTDGDRPVVGDWNGDGRTTIGVMRGSKWLLKNSNTGGAADIEFHYGRGAIDFPMAGDWNANGRDTPAIVRDGEWHLRNSLSGGDFDIRFKYGRVKHGDIPVVGDWTGNGVDTPGILRNGYWHLRNVHAGGTADEVFIFGRLRSGDTPIIGDWNGNGRATIGVTRGGEWHLRNSLSGGKANLTFTYR